jgi:peroxiredoxin Q/BCP
MKKISICILILTMGLMAHTNAQVALGDKVPSFTSLDQDNLNWVLKKELRKADYTVIYFYPTAFTGGCTKQACSYRDHKGELEAVKAQVVGISGDNPGTLGLFAMEHHLNFSMLSDQTGEIAKLFGVPVGEGGTHSQEIKGKAFELKRGATIQRWTFILDKESALIYKDSEVDAANDSNKVLEFLSSL